MDHLRSTRHHEGAECPKKGTWGDFGCWDHSNLQAHVTSDLAKAQGWGRTTAEGPQDTRPSETGLCKAGGSSIEEASGFILLAVITACDNLRLPPALFSDTAKPQKQKKPKPQTPEIKKPTSNFNVLPTSKFHPEEW